MAKFVRKDDEIYDAIFCVVTAVWNKLRPVHIL